MAVGVTTRGRDRPYAPYDEVVGEGAGFRGDGCTACRYIDHRALRLLGQLRHDDGLDEMPRS
jgi:hypothetical protein